MNIQKRFRQANGFTLVEILIVVAIIVLITGITVASVRASRDKAADAETRKVVSEVALRAESQEIAPGVVDYQKAFTAVSASTAISELAVKLKLVDGEYQSVVSADSYAIVFPLKKGGYYCVDSLGHANGKEVTGLFPLTGPQNCSTATRSTGRPIGWGGPTGGDGGPDGGGGGNQPPVIAFAGVDGFEGQGMQGPGICSPDGCVVMYDHTDPHLTDPYYIANQFGYATETDPRITQYRIETVFQFPWGGFTANDPEDGNITGSLDYNTEAVYEKYTSVTTAAASQIASYVNNTVQNGTTHYVVSECDWSYYQYTVYVQDSQFLGAEKPFKIYSCIITP